MTSLRTSRAPRRIWREVVVSLGAVVGLACIVLAVLAGGFGIKPLVFTSGSMAPEIRTGALAFAQDTPAADLAIGDVVSVVDAEGVRVTHRVVSTSSTSGGTSLTLKGDANQTADAAPYVVTTGDRVLLDIPYGGYAVTWLTSPAGLIAGGLLVSVALLAAFSPSQGPRHVRVSVWRSTVRAAIAVSVIGVSTQASIQFAPTQAFWTDSAGASSGLFSTVASIPAPASSSCDNNGSSVTGQWASTGPRHQYQVTVNRLDGAQVGVPQYFTSTSATLNPASFASPATFQATGQFNFQFRVKSAALNSTTWLSAGSTTIPFRFNKNRSAIVCGNITSTTVSIDSLADDTGSSQTDFITKNPTNALVGSTPAGFSSTIVVKRNGSAIGTASADDTGAWTFPITSFLAEKSQTYSAEATDYLGNVATTVQPVRLDTLAPAVSQSTSACNTGNAVAGVQNAFWCKVTTLTMSATIADETDGSGIAAREYADGNSTFAAYTGSVPLGEAKGRVVQVRGTDVAGNSSTDSKTYYIDGTAPAVSVSSPVAGTTSALVLRNNVIAACGANRVGCGSVTDMISGPSASVSPAWNLRRDYLSCFLIFCNARTDYLNSSGSAYTAQSSTTPTTPGGGGLYSVVVGGAATTFYSNGTYSYTLTISGAEDAAGNRAPDFVRSFDTQ